MFWFILTVIFVIAVIVGIVLSIRWRDTGNNPPRAAFVSGTVVAFVITGILFGVNFFTSVQANNVGIVTSFGKPVGTANAGLHFLMPWESVDSFSTRVQITEFTSAGNNCLEVNLKGGAQACADITVRYVINPEDAVALWQRYGGFDTVKNSLLTSATNNAAKIIYGQYAPQDAVSGDALPAITKGMTGELKNQLADSGLTLVAVAPGQLHLSANNQDNFDEILKAQTNAQVAQQNLKVSQAQAQANEALTGSLSPQILCEDYLKAIEQIKPTVVDGGPCSTGGTSSGTPVIVNPSK